MRDENAPAPRWTDHEVDQVIGRLLQAGVLIATIVVVAGCIGLLRSSGSAIVDHRTFIGAAPELRSVGGVVRAAFAGRADAITQLGLILLIATPIARVALTLVAFVVQRDRLYVLLTGVVLVLLTWGLVAG